MAGDEHECLSSAAEGGGCFLGSVLQAWHASISTQLREAMSKNAEAIAGQPARIELAVESCLAAAVRRRVTDTLWQQHAAADRLLLHNARSLADGSSQLLPRSSSMAEANATVNSCGRPVMVICKQLLPD